MSTLFFCTLPSRSAEPFGNKDMEIHLRETRKKDLWITSELSNWDCIDEKWAPNSSPFQKKVPLHTARCSRYIFQSSKVKTCVEKAIKCIRQLQRLVYFDSRVEYLWQEAFPTGSTGYVWVPVLCAIPYRTSMVLYYYEDLNLSTRALSQFLNDLFFWKNVSNNF